MSLQITGTGHYTPDKVLNNSDLEKMVDTSDEWIRTRTGILERRIAEDDVATSDLALIASQRALEMAKLSPEDIDLVVVATITQDKYFPSTSCILQRKLGAVNSVCFDLHAACSGLLYSLETVNSLMVCHKKYRNALVIGAEKLTSLVDWEDRNTCVLFGDGAGALVLSRIDDGAEQNFQISTSLGADGSYEDILHVPAGGSKQPASHETVDNKLHYMRMAGQEVFKLAVNAMVNACRDVMAEAGVSTGEIRWLVPHQANLRILKAVGTRLKIPIERIFINVDKYGNTSAASIGIAFDEIVRSGQIQKGDYLLLTSFGGGLTWAANLIRW